MLFPQSCFRLSGPLVSSSAVSSRRDPNRHALQSPTSCQRAFLLFIFILFLVHTTVTFYYFLSSQQITTPHLRIVAIMHTPKVVSAILEPIAELFHHVKKHFHDASHDEDGDGSPLSHQASHKARTQFRHVLSSVKLEAAEDLALSNRKYLDKKAGIRRGKHEKLTCKLETPPFNGTNNLDDADRHGANQCQDSTISFTRSASATAPSGLSKYLAEVIAKNGPRSRLELYSQRRTQCAC